MHGVKVKFLCSLRLLPSSLDKLAKALPRESYKILPREFGDNFELLTKKLIFPYDLVTSYNSLFEITEPPKKELFKNTLTEQHCTEEEYSNFINIWNLFQIKSLHQYMKLYLKIDVILLTEVCLHAREFYFKNFSLDLLSMETISRFSFNAGLLSTRAEIEPLTDASMYDFFRKGF